MSEYLFFITPIGARDSKDRARFSRVLDLILRPAMRGSGLQLITALDFELQTTITNAIVESVQGARLCVADISGSNPNVMFELGMRRQTGLPYITIIEEGFSPPFDTSVEKYLGYNLSVLETVIEAQDEIAKAIDRAINAPQDQIQSKPTLEGIARQLAAIEQRLSGLPIGRVHTPDNRQDELAISPFVPPQHQVATYISRGDPRKAIRAILAWLDQVGPKREMAPALGVLGQTGDPALLPLLEQLAVFIATGDVGFCTGIVATINGLARTLGSSYDFAAIASIVSDRSAELSLSADGDFGMLANQLAMMWWTLEDMENAEKWGLKSIDVDPNVASYHYNLSFPLLKRNAVDRAVDELRKALELGASNPDPDHFDRLVDVLAGAGRIPEATEVNDQLRRIDPVMASANDRAHFSRR